MGKERMHSHGLKLMRSTQDLSEKQTLTLPETQAVTYNSVAQPHHQYQIRRMKTSIFALVVPPSEG